MHLSTGTPSWLDLKIDIDCVTVDGSISHFLFLCIATFGPISFIFMQFSAKILPNNRLSAQIKRPILWKSWNCIVQCINYNCSPVLYNNTVADLHSQIWRPPSRSNFFIIFIQFLRKFGKIIGSCPFSPVGKPPTKSWIWRCNDLYGTSNGLWSKNKVPL